MKNLLLVCLLICITIPANISFAANAPVPKIDSSKDDVERRGVTWPDPRYTDHEDGTITDHLTGLMWMKDGNCIANYLPDFDNDGTVADGRVTWQHALDFATLINTQAQISNQCGVRTTYTDWRLPNRRELWSHIDFSTISNDPPYTPPSLPANHLFTEVYSFYWSSTNYVGQYSPPSRFTSAWNVYMDSGKVSVGSKSSHYYVWLVRAGR